MSGVCLLLYLIERVKVTGSGCKLYMFFEAAPAPYLPLLEIDFLFFTLKCFFTSLFSLGCASE